MISYRSGHLPIHRVLLDFVLEETVAGGVILVASDGVRTDFHAVVSPEDTCSSALSDHKTTPRRGSSIATCCWAVSAEADRNTTARCTADGMGIRGSEGGNRLSSYRRSSQGEEILSQDIILKATSRVNQELTRDSRINSKAACVQTNLPISIQSW
jgi:hypothetical protein